MERLPPLESEPVIEAYKRHVDVTLLREGLALSPDERVRRLVRWQANWRELHRAGVEMRARRESR